MKVIFLDVDGVLNSKQYLIQTGNGGIFDEIDTSKVKLLKDLIDETNSKVVISSSWRIGYSKTQGTVVGKRTELFAKLEDTLKEFDIEIFSCTPKLPGPRGDEIKQWLIDNKNLEIDGFVILDDDSDMNELMDHLCNTTWEFGLTSEDILKAKEILNKDVKIYE